MSEYVTVSQLASELNVSVHRVYRRIYRGDIKADYVHSRYPHYVIARDEVQRFKDAGGMKAMNRCTSASTRSWPCPKWPCAAVSPPNASAGCVLRGSCGTNAMGHGAGTASGRTLLRLSSPDFPLTLTGDTTSLVVVSASSVGLLTLKPFRRQSWGLFRFRSIPGKPPLTAPGEAALAGGSPLSEGRSR